MPPGALDQKKTALPAHPSSLVPPREPILDLALGKEGLSCHILFSCPRTNPIVDDTPSSFTRGCFQLILGLRNYGDYSSWLFPSSSFAFKFVEASH